MKVKVKQIRIWQAISGLSVNEMLKKADIPRGTWTSMLSNKVASAKTAEKLAAALGCDVTDITE